uniref:Trafficking protein particle complex subunit 2 n=1 Tax=Populus trichocarpa TaxID=3694 RepID=A0A2K2B935_POPTR
MATTACFIIVSRNDIPIYEAEVGSATKREDAAQMHQFILHAALDIVQDLAWTTSAMYLKAIDRFNDMVVSVYVTAGHILYLCYFMTLAMMMESRAFSRRFMSCI